ncbi:MAG TPA: metallophosphoesterase family protein [Candidatus Pacearchaeota archaeon]|nr:metallophosphoesterase family protein [Candidatus Pacearchaeota archaeon]HOS12858.1 metallophosphoesterase family protein [Candidatus Pacearchaeota archaeon]
MSKENGNIIDEEQMISEEKENDDKKNLFEHIVEFYLAHGTKKTLEAFPTITEETLNRYKRKYRAKYDSFNDVIARIIDKFSEEDLENIAQLNNKKDYYKIKDISFSGQDIKFLVLGDTHIGSVFFDPVRLRSAFAEAKKENCNFFVHAGDITEGYMNRPDSIYECSEIGFSSQRDKAIEILSEWGKDKKGYLINGNHDLSFNSKLGAGCNMAQDICEKLGSNFEYLGDGEGYLTLNGISIKLFHGADAGSSYALSYRLQRIINNMSPEQKPNILIAGHDHKSFYMHYRNIHALASGCIQKQTGYMAQKGLIAMEGFWIISMRIKDKEVKRFQPCFYPFYK